MKRQYLIWLMLFAACLYCVGCGVKAYPKPPKQEPLPVVDDLRYRMERDTVVLNWSVPFSKALSEKAGCVVYRSVMRPDEAACEGCPLTFERIAEIPLENSDVDDTGMRRMRYVTPVQPGYQYRYKVTLKPQTGPEGEDSNIVAVSP